MADPVPAAFLGYEFAPGQLPVIDVLASEDDVYPWVRSRIDPDAWAEFHRSLPAVDSADLPAAVGDGDARTVVHAYAGEPQARPDHGIFWYWGPDTELGVVPATTWDPAAPTTPAAS